MIINRIRSYIRRITPADETHLKIYQSDQIARIVGGKPLND